MMSSPMIGKKYYVKFLIFLQLMIKLGFADMLCHIRRQPAPLPLLHLSLLLLVKK